MIDISQIRGLINKIKTETKKGGNTKERVAKTLETILNLYVGNQIMKASVKDGNLHVEGFPLEEFQTITSEQGIDIGRIGLVPKGEWEENQKYDLLDMVGYEGNAYVSKKENNNSTLDVVSDWMLIAKKGAVYFADLTPEDILLLQQPALEAAESANEAAQVAHIATENANVVTGNAITATNNVNQAILEAQEVITEAQLSTTNALLATTNANTATTSANNASISATTAAENAYTAAQLANDSVVEVSNVINEANEVIDNANTAAVNAATAAGSAASASTSANNAATNANDKAAIAQIEAANANSKAAIAESAATNANNKAQLATAAVTNANTATTNANTAAANANDKAAIAQAAATNANTAASNADTSATAATNAAGSANTAATNANNAAAFANSQRGWQPLIVSDTTTIPGKVLSKLADWIGGTGTKPTDYVGQWQTAAGDYTSTAANALDLTSIVSTNVSNDVENLTWANKNLNVFTITGRYYFLSNGGFVPNASYNSTPLYRVKEGMKFKNPFMGEGGVAQVAFFKSDNTFLSAVQGQAEITAPAGAFFVGFSRPASSAESIKVQTDFWAMQQDNMVVRYVQAGNKEVTVTSNTGNVLNAVGHGFVNGDRVILSLVATPTNNEIVSIVGRVPILGAIPVGTANGDVGYYVVNATTDTFQLSATSGGAPLSVNANPNFTAFKFEKAAPGLLLFSGLPASNNYKVLISGGCYRLPQYIQPNYTSSNGSKINTTGTAISGGGLRMNKSAVVADGVITIASGKSGFFLTQEYKVLAADATGNLVTDIVNDSIFHFSDKRDITQIGLASIGLSNGSVIKIIRE